MPKNKASDQLDGRERSIKRGLDFIYRAANTKDGFDSYGSLLICCFALVGATSRDAKLRQLARSRAEKLAARWERLYPHVPTGAGPDLITRLVLVRYALSRIGLRNAVLNAEIRAAAKQFSAHDLLGFDPVGEPPANDLPYACDCGLKNLRGRKFCKQCRKRLEIYSPFRVWMGALAGTYVGERGGIRLGARYQDVLKWLPTMRPYPAGANADVAVLRDAAYAITHVVYTLNDYGTYRLRPGLLAPEFEFLKTNVAGACERKDPELLGELLDSLKAFGLRDSHPLIARGSKFLLQSQNEDGSWGDPDEESIRRRCHTTWTAIDGLRNYAWRGERLSLPEVRPMLKRWRRSS